MSDNKVDRILNYSDSDKARILCYLTGAYEQLNDDIFFELVFRAVNSLEIKENRGVEYVKENY